MLLWCAQSRGDGEREKEGGEKKRQRVRQKNASYENPIKKNSSLKDATLERFMDASSS